MTDHWKDVERAQCDLDDYACGWQEPAMRMAVDALNFAVDAARAKDAEAHAAALADARLMAAAPDLLEACEAMFAYYAMPTDHYAPSNQALAKAWIAITKAKKEAEDLRPTERT